MSRGLGSVQRRILKFLEQDSRVYTASQLTAELCTDCERLFDVSGQTAPPSPPATPAQDRSVRRALYGLCERGLLLDSRATFPLPTKRRCFGTRAGFESLLAQWLEAIEEKAEETPEEFSDAISELHFLQSNLRSHEALSKYRRASQKARYGSANQKAALGANEIREVITMQEHLLTLTTSKADRLEIYETLTQLYRLPGQAQDDPNPVVDSAAILRPASLSDGLLIILTRNMRRLTSLADDVDLVERAQRMRANLLATLGVKG